MLLLSSNPATVMAAQQAGMVAAILAKPLLRADLYRRLQALSAPLAVAPPAPPGQARQLRVLAAEDNRTNQLVFRKMVKDLDMDLQFASNGHEAVEMFQAFKPDMVFMDISMPIMDGREAARAIRALEGDAAHVPIIALTAHAMAGDATSIRAAGIDHIMTKPLRRGAICDMLTSCTPAGVRPPLPAPQAETVAG